MTKLSRSDNDPSFIFISLNFPGRGAVDARLFFTSFIFWLGSTDFFFFLSWRDTSFAILFILFYFLSLVLDLIFFFF